MPNSVSIHYLHCVLTLSSAVFSNIISSGYPYTVLQRVPKHCPYTMLPFAALYIVSVHRLYTVSGYTVPCSILTYCVYMFSLHCPSQYPNSPSSMVSCYTYLHTVYTYHLSTLFLSCPSTMAPDTVFTQSLYVFPTVSAYAILTRCLSDPFQHSVSLHCSNTASPYTVPPYTLTPDTVPPYTVSSYSVPKIPS